MKAGENKLIRFLEGHDKRFVIPVYQRNYDWNKENCKQLYDDLIDVINNNRKSHFFGPIVFIYNDDADGQEYIVIDGQQRITTISILMLAIYHHLLINKNDNIDIELIKNEYLIGKYNKEEKLKLKPIKNDNKAFKLLFENDKESFTASNLTNNYLYFHQRIQKNEVPIDDLFNSIKKLDVVEIKLKVNEDDPQLIFESLNSTGLDLTEADKVRNFILMSLNSRKQEEYYEKYWNKIEENTKYNVSNYLRDYLTFKEKKAPNKNKVYFAFKEFVIDNDEFSNLETLLQELLKFSKYYSIIISNHYENKNISEYLAYLNKLDVSVAYPFLLELFNMHIDEKIITADKMTEILSIIESFIVRRIICEVPTNALNKIFMTLGRDIQKFDDYKENYVEILKYVLSQKRGSQRFPDDIEFGEKFKNKDIYNMNSKNKLHFLERLENYRNREKVDIQNLLDNGDLSIEHIMPQTLSKTWKSELGDAYQNIHDKYLHTIGNITLTAYNSELSNKSFNEKKTIEGGFNQSRLFLNEFLKTIDSWNEARIQERAKKLNDRSLNIWVNVNNSYENKRDIENTYSLDDEYNFTGEKIKYFEFLGEEFQVETWIDFYQQLHILLFDLEATKYKRFLEDNDFKKRINFISDSGSNLRKPIQIANDLFLEGNLSTESILNISKMILDKLEIEHTEVSLCLREKNIN